MQCKSIAMTKHEHCNSRADYCMRRMQDRDSSFTQTRYSSSATLHPPGGGPRRPRRRPLHLFFSGASTFTFIYGTPFHLKSSTLLNWTTIFRFLSLSQAWKAGPRTYWSTIRQSPPQTRPAPTPSIPRLSCRSRLLPQQNSPMLLVEPADSLTGIG